MKNFAIAFILAAYVATPLTQAQQQWKPDGTALLQHCQAAIRLIDTAAPLEKDYAPAVACASLFHGVSDLAQVRPDINFPEGYTEEQGLRVVVKYLEEHPEDLNKRDTVLIVQALRKAFPKKTK